MPLVFGEQFSLQQNGSAALKVLQTRYRIVPISVADPQELTKGRLLLMAQPQAQPAEDLVALDAWVGRGGRLLLLADPLLEWPSERPLGDPLRPPAMYADTGLLAHWGLRLDAPDERGRQEVKAGWLWRRDDVARPVVWEMQYQFATAWSLIVASAEVGRRSSLTRICLMRRAWVAEHRIISTASSRACAARTEVIR